MNFTKYELEQNWEKYLVKFKHTNYKCALLLFTNKAYTISGGIGINRPRILEQMLSTTVY